MTGARDKLLRHVHGWRTDIKREMVLSLNDEEVASPKKIPNSRLECTNHTLFQTKMVEIPISDQKGPKTIPFCAAHTHIAYIREYPPRTKNALQGRLIKYACISCVYV